jgi:hypothetical protein
MAKPCTRTHADEVTDALAKLADAEREMRNWRGHLEAQLVNPHPGHALMAVRVKNIVVNAVLDAATLTQYASNALHQTDHAA